MSNQLKIILKRYQGAVEHLDDDDSDFDVFDYQHPPSVDHPVSVSFESDAYVRFINDQEVTPIIRPVDRMKNSTLRTDITCLRRSYDARSKLFDKYTFEQDANCDWLLSTLYPRPDMKVFKVKQSNAVLVHVPTPFFKANRCPHVSLFGIFPHDIVATIMSFVPVPHYYLPWGLQDNQTHNVLFNYSDFHRFNTHVLSNLTGTQPYVEVSVNSTSDDRFEQGLKNNFMFKDLSRYYFNLAVFSESASYSNRYIPREILCIIMEYAITVMKYNGEHVVLDTRSKPLGKIMHTHGPEKWLVLGKKNCSSSYRTLCCNMIATSWFGIASRHIKPFLGDAAVCPANGQEMDATYPKYLAPHTHDNGQVQIPLKPITIKGAEYIALEVEENHILVICYYDSLVLEFLLRCEVALICAMETWFKGKNRHRDKGRSLRMNTVLPIETESGRCMTPRSCTLAGIVDQDPPFVNTYMEVPFRLGRDYMGSDANLDILYLSNFVSAFTSALPPFEPFLVTHNLVALPSRNALWRIRFDDGAREYHEVPLWGSSNRIATKVRVVDYPQSSPWG